MMLELVYGKNHTENTYMIETFYTWPTPLGTIPANGRVSTGRIGLPAFPGGSEGGGTFDIREANICILGRDVFGGEVSFYGSIGYFESFEAYTKHKGHPGRLSPSSNRGSLRKTLETLENWVAERHSK